MSGKHKLWVWWEQPGVTVELPPPTPEVVGSWIVLRQVTQSRRAQREGPYTMIGACLELPSERLGHKLVRDLFPGARNPQAIKRNARWKPEHLR